MNNIHSGSPRKHMSKQLTECWAHACRCLGGTELQASVIRLAKSSVASNELRLTLYLTIAKTVLSD